MNPFESAPAVTMQGKFDTADTHKYSVILPTYNERKNLPVIVWLLAKTLEEKYVPWLVRISPCSPVHKWVGLGDYRRRRR